MPVIKRYPNRKLYDTEAKKYITLGGIAELIRQNQHVQVVDHTSGDDLTALTLSQIILEQEKRHGGFLPYSVLVGLIRAGGDTLSGLRRALSFSLGLWHHLDEEIQRRIQLLVGQGKLTQEEGRYMLDKLCSQDLRLRSPFFPNEEYFEQLVLDRWVPTRHDVQRVIDQLDALTAKVEELGQNAD